MPQTYKAVLRGNQLEWEDTPPPQVKHHSPLNVYVLVMDAPSTPETAASGQAMALILAQLAQRDAFSAIPDPVAWQREQRSERSLPGREA